MSLAGKRVVELGSGHGFVSVAAAKLGATEVYCTDGDEGSIALCTENVLQNGVAECVHVQQLLWGNVEQEQAVAPPFDVVIASDVAALVYEGAFSALVESLKAMSSPDSLIVIAYEKRHGIEAKFFHKLGKVFTWSERKPTHADFKDVHNLFVLTLRWKAAQTN
jgi:predicted nicotinamide N-methyase